MVCGLDHRWLRRVGDVAGADTKRGDFCFGHAPTIADVHLVPQVQSARHFQIDLAPWLHIRTVDSACAVLDAFRLAAPVMQPDAV